MDEAEIDSALASMALAATSNGDEVGSVDSIPGPPPMSHHQMKHIQNNISSSSSSISGEHDHDHEQQQKLSSSSSSSRRMMSGTTNERSNHSNRSNHCHSPELQQQQQHLNGNAVPRSGNSGEMSPSAVARARRHSPVIVTSNKSCHELSEGRESILVPAQQVHQQHQQSSPSPVGLLRTSLSALRLPSLPKLKRDDSVQRSQSDVMHDEQHSTEYLHHPPPLRLDAWTEPPGTSFLVRGPQYMNNGLKIRSLPSIFRLLTVDLVKVDKPYMKGLCSHPRERIQLALAREQATGVQELPAFIFAVNLVIPGKSIYHTVFYFGIDDIDLIRDMSTPFGRIANPFFFGDSDAFRNQTFKLIPLIVEGNFIVRKAVGSKPAILGRKIKQTYIRTNRFMELMVDIASESVASKIVTLSIGYAKTLAVDMAFVLEGNDKTTLPEQLMGAVRLKQIDFKKKDGQRTVA